MDGAEGTQFLAGEGGVGGDDGVQVVGAIPLARPSWGAAAGAYPGQQAAAGRSSRPTHQVVRAGGAGTARSSQPSGAAPDGEREPQGAGLHRPSRPLRPDPDTIQQLHQRGVTVETLPTSQAVRRLGELDPARTAVVLHLTS